MASGERQDDNWDPGFCCAQETVAGLGSVFTRPVCDDAVMIRIDRPDMPEGYGVPAHTEGLLDWLQVEDRLTRSAHYWLSTTRPDGRPHTIPRWGVWLEGRFWYDGAPTTRHVQNLLHNNACSLHLEDGARAVIVEGTSEQSDPVGGALARSLSDTFTAKYGDEGYSPRPDAWSDEIAGGLRILTPHKIMAWTEFPVDVTRFRFS